MLGCELTHSIVEVLTWSLCATWWDHKDQNSAVGRLSSLLKDIQSPICIVVFMNLNCDASFHSAITCTYALQHNHVHNLWVEELTQVKHWELPKNTLDFNAISMRSFKHILFQKHSENIFSKKGKLQQHCFQTCHHYYALPCLL